MATDPGTEEQELCYISRGEGRKSGPLVKTLSSSGEVVYRESKTSMGRQSCSESSLAALSPYLDAKTLIMNDAPLRSQITDLKQARKAEPGQESISLTTSQTTCSPPQPHTPTRHSKTDNTTCTQHNRGLRATRRAIISTREKPSHPAVDVAGQKVGKAQSTGNVVPNGPRLTSCEPILNRAHSSPSTYPPAKCATEVITVWDKNNYKIKTKKFINSDVRDSNRRHSQLLQNSPRNTADRSSCNSLPNSPELRTKCLSDLKDLAMKGRSRLRLSCRLDNTSVPNNCIKRPLSSSVSCQRLKYALASCLLPPVTPPPISLVTSSNYTESFTEKPPSPDNPDNDHMTFLVTGKRFGGGLQRTRSLYMPRWFGSSDTNKHSTTNSSAKIAQSASIEKSHNRCQTRPKSFHGGDLSRLGNLLQPLVISRHGPTDSDTKHNTPSSSECSGDDITPECGPQRNINLSLGNEANNFTNTRNGSLSTLDVITAYLEQLRMRRSSSGSDGGETEEKQDAVKTTNHDHVKFTRDKLVARSREDLLILLDSFYQQIQVVSEELVVILQTRHELREQVDMRRVAVEQLVRMHNAPSTSDKPAILSSHQSSMKMNALLHSTHTPAGSS